MLNTSRFFCDILKIQKVLLKFNAPQKMFWPNILEQRKGKIRMNIPATLEQRISKAGKPYKCIIVKLTADVEKMIFLTDAEMALLELTANSKIKLNPANG